MKANVQIVARNLLDPSIDTSQLWLEYIKLLARHIEQSDMAIYQFTSHNLLIYYSLILIQATIELINHPMNCLPETDHFTDVHSALL